MRVEHYDNDTRTVRILMEDDPQPDPTDIRSSLNWWMREYERLTMKVRTMPFVKMRQAVALARDSAGVKVRLYKQRFERLVNQQTKEA